MSLSFKNQIVSALGKLEQSLPSPDTSNSGTLLAKAYMWDEIESHAKAQSKKYWEELEKDHIEKPTEVGEHALLTTKSFVCNANVTNPVKRFDPTELENIMLKSRFKVPKPVMREHIEKAKIPGKSAVRYSIAEKN